MPLVKNNQRKEVVFCMLLVLKLSIIESTPSSLGFNIDHNCMLTYLDVNDDVKVDFIISMCH